MIFLLRVSSPILNSSQWCSFGQRWRYVLWLKAESQWFFEVSLASLKSIVPANSRILIFFDTQIQLQFFSSVNVTVMHRTTTCMHVPPRHDRCTMIVCQLYVLSHSNLTIFIRKCWHWYKCRHCKVIRIEKNMAPRTAVKKNIHVLVAGR